jgi:mono/diheme cytochrome c family protein
MSSVAKRLVAVGGLVAVLVVAAACGTQSISVPKSKGTLYQGAVLFNQRCSGCHTLSYAATQGSAQNVRTAQYNNGPNFNVRCERPVTRVLYAIQNGGFSGAVMPQNIVVGQQARDVAQFVATYSGRRAPKVPGVVQCEQVPIGSIDAALATPTTATTSTTTTSPSPQTLTGTTTTKKPAAKAKAKAKAKAAHK